MNDRVRRRAVAEWHGKARAESDSVARALLQTEMRFERDLGKVGGLLAAGSDPCCLTAIAGYADQRSRCSPAAALALGAARGAQPRVVRRYTLGVNPV